MGSPIESLATVTHTHTHTHMHTHPPAHACAPRTHCISGNTEGEVSTAPSLQAKRPVLNSSIRCPLSMSYFGSLPRWPMDCHHEAQEAHWRPSPATAKTGPTFFCPQTNVRASGRVCFFFEGGGGCRKGVPFAYGLFLDPVHEQGHQE